MAQNTPSLIKLIEMIQQVSQNHLMVKNFRFGPQWDMDNTWIQIQTPYVWLMEPTQRTIKGQQGFSIALVEFKMYCMDRISVGESNYTEILSDCKYILETIINEIDQHPLYVDLGISFDPNSDITYEPQEEETDTNSNGYLVTFTLRYPIRYSPCNNPITSLAGYTYSLNNNVYQYSVVGVPGPTGPQGPADGPQGPTGPQGFQGDQGTQGPIGAQGDQGTQGPIGAQGDQGTQGPIGAQGFQGDQGTQGPIGAQGFQGPTGPQGFQGDQGTQGPIGAQGFQGTQGPTGPQGFQGIIGPSSIITGTANQIAYYAINGVTISGTNSVNNIIFQNGNAFGATMSIGTIDNQKLHIITNNISRMVIGTMGGVRIIATPQGSSSSLHIDSTVTNSGTDRYSALLLNVTETSVGSGPNRLIDVSNQNIFGLTTSFILDNSGVLNIQNNGEQAIIVGNTQSSVKTFIGVGRIGQNYGQNVGYIAFGSDPATTTTTRYTSAGASNFANFTLYNTTTSATDILGSNNTNGFLFDSAVKLAGGGLRPSASGYSLISLQISNGNNILNGTLSTVGNYFAVNHRPTLVMGGSVSAGVYGYSSNPTIISTSPTTIIGGFIDNTILATSSSSSVQSFIVNTTINTGLTGIHRGLYINPTLTSVGGGWRSIEDNANLLGGYSIYQSGGNMINYLNGKILVGSTTDTGNGRVQVHGNLSLEDTGNGLAVKEATNATLGQATLVGGAVLVPNTTVTGASRVFLSRATASGTLGHLSYTMSSGVSFTITSSSATDTSAINWFIIKAI